MKNTAQCLFAALGALMRRSGINLKDLAIRHPEVFIPIIMEQLSTRKESSGQSMPHINRF
jgi:hypothetical protein